MISRLSALSVAAFALFALSGPAYAQDTAPSTDAPAQTAPAATEEKPANGDDRTAGTGAPKQTAVPDSSDTYKQLNLFGDVFERVRAQYVEPKTDEELIEFAINGMLTNLDPHSDYLDEKDFGDMQVQTRGEFGGLGIEVTTDNGVVKVVSPIDDTPAFRAGVLAGDYITHLDGENIVGLSLNESVDKMRGKVGAPIELTIRREGAAEPIKLTIVRDVIKIQSVRWKVYDESLGYIRITTFNQNTETGVRTAVEEIKAKTGDKLKGYVLDLRNNPGGLLDQAISVSDLFLDKGEIVSTRGRDESNTKRDNATPGDIANGKPIVILINGGSASASEIVSGALQDHRRALVVGTKSFGKGSVQTVIPLPGHGAMRLTTARYYTPSGRSIQATGIEPDIAIEQAKLETVKGSSFGEADLRGALDNGLKKDEAESSLSADLKAEADAQKKKDDPNAKDATSEGLEDYQLARALDLVKGIMLYEQRLEGATPAANPVTETPKPDAKKE